MIYEMLGAKIHRATVTEANIDYVGSIAIDKDILSATGILVNEKVHVWDLTNGQRLVTYVIEGGPGEIMINGAAAKRISKGDKVIISCFRFFDEKEIKVHKPLIVFPDENNKISPDK